MTETRTEVTAAPVRKEIKADFRDLVASEWLKLWSLRSTAWTLLLSALAIFVFNCYSAYGDYANLEKFSADARADFSKYAMFDAFTTASCVALMLSLGAIGANIVISEYNTGLIRSTFVAVPARGAVMAAKLVVVTAVSSAYALVVVGGSFFVTQAILDGKDVGLSITDPGVPERLLASVLMAPLTALVAMAIGVLVKHSIGTLTTFVLSFMLLPLALSERLYATAVLGHMTPYRAWLRIADIEFGNQPYPWTTSGGWTVYAVWAVVAMIVSVLVVKRRDH
ncbi:ABC transporter permease [Micromonospora sp. HNM0581]|uniref:ABC transporter permease n=1 Tax=Micromonospora sp. HNM0581 TaxID=2716341 RepID=UPI001F0F9C61|nr:ABC transporter permease [Micromonospora sp. HNM0581]